jgi:hypothetical protein
MKTCFKCGAAKPYTEFYKHKGMKDGYLGKCKTCTKSDTKKNREANLEYYQEYDRKRHHSNPERRPANLEASRRWRKKNAARHAEHTKAWAQRNPEKRKAHSAVANALRDGKIERNPCEVCGGENVQAHHHDYSKPLDVVWLCSAHHAQHHVDEREDQRVS